MFGASNKSLERLDSNEVIRSGSIKSVAAAGAAEQGAPADGSGKELAGLRKHSWCNTLGLAALLLLAGTALGVAIWGAAEGVSNSNDIDALYDAMGVSSNGEASQADSFKPWAWPETLLRSEPTPVPGYTYQASLGQGSGYWAPRPSITLAAPAAYLSAAINGNMAWLTGGRHVLSDGTIYTENRVQRFDAVLGLYGDAADMPEARSAHTAVYLGGKVYVVGGYRNGDDLLSGDPATGMLVFNASSNEWSSAPGPDKPRGRACAAAVGGKLYIVGGFKEGQQPSDSVEQYDPETNDWKEVAKLPFARGGSGCTAVGSTIYVAGGTRYFTAESKTGATDEFLAVEVKDGGVAVKQLSPLLSPRSGLSLVAANDADGSLLALGGMMLASNGGSVYQVGHGRVQAFLPAHGVWVEKAPMAAPRFAAAAVSAGHGAYVFGGNAVCEQDSGRCNALDSVEVFEFSDVPDVFLHTRDPSFEASGSAPQSDVVLAGRHDGGLSGSGGEQYALLGSLYMGAGYWAARDPMPMGHLSDFTLLSVPNAKGEVAGAYLVGGANWDQLSDSMWLFDAYLGRWAQMPAMPEPRTRHAAAVVGGRIYVVGGYSNWTASQEGAPATNMLVYDIGAGEWSTSSNGPPAVRSDACAAAVGGKLYLAGGYGAGFGSALDTVEVYDPDSAAWSSAPSMPTPRGDALCAALAGRFVVLGGYHDPSGEWAPNSFRAEVEAFDPADNAWAELAAMPHPRGDMAVVALPGERLMVMGGETVAEDESRTMVASNEVAEYLAAQDVWVPKAPMIENRFRHAATYLANSVYVFGGSRSHPTGGYDDAPPGLASSEAFYYAQAPDVFVWRKVPSGDGDGGR